MDTTYLIKRPLFPLEWAKPPPPSSPHFGEILKNKTTDEIKPSNQHIERSVAPDNIGLCLKLGLKCEKGSGTPISYSELAPCQTLLHELGSKLGKPAAHVVL